MTAATVHACVFCTCLQVVRTVATCNWKLVVLDFCFFFLCVCVGMYEQGGM